MPGACRLAPGQVRWGPVWRMGQALVGWDDSAAVEVGQPGAPTQWDMLSSRDTEAHTVGTFGWTETQAGWRQLGRAAGIAQCKKVGCRDRIVARQAPKLFAGVRTRPRIAIESRSSLNHRVVACLSSSCRDSTCPWQRPSWHGKLRLHLHLLFTLVSKGQRGSAEGLQTRCCAFPLCAKDTLPSLVVPLLALLPGEPKKIEG